MASLNLAVVGVTWFDRDEVYDWNEVNIYLMFLKISVRW